MKVEEKNNSDLNQDTEDNKKNVNIDVDEDGDDEIRARLVPVINDLINVSRGKLEDVYYNTLEQILSIH